MRRAGARRRPRPGKGVFAWKSVLSYGVKAVAYKGSGCVGCGICFYNCPEPYAIRIVRKGGAQ